MRLNPAADSESKQAEGRVLIQFAIQLAEEQLAGGRHFVMENPLLSGCWKLPEMVKFLEENFVHLARFDQCRFGLRSAAGHLHRKATLVAWFVHHPTGRSLSYKIGEDYGGRHGEAV